MKNFSVVMLAAVAAVLIQSVLSDDAQAELQNKIKLGKVLAKDYDKLYGPGNATLKVAVMFVCAQYDLKEKHLHTRVFERYSWKDWRLQWDPSKFGGIRVLKVPSDLLWKPDVNLFNAVGESEHRDDVRAILLSDGTVYWVPPTTYTTVCGPGERMHDRKVHCHLSLGSWTYDEEDLPLALMDSGVDTKMYLDDCPHVMSNIEARIKHTKYSCCPDPFASLEIDFDLEERKVFKHHDSDESDEKHPKLAIDCEWPHC